MSCIPPRLPQTVAAPTKQNESTITSLLDESNIESRNLSDCHTMGSLNSEQQSETSNQSTESCTIEANSSCESDIECLSDCQTIDFFDSTYESVATTDKTDGPNTPFPPPSTQWSNESTTVSTANLKDFDGENFDNKWTNDYTPTQYPTTLNTTRFNYTQILLEANITRRVHHPTPTTLDTTHFDYQQIRREANFNHEDNIDHPTPTTLEINTFTYQKITTGTNFMSDTELKSFIDEPNEELSSPSNCQSKAAASCSTETSTTANLRDFDGENLDDEWITPPPEDKASKSYINKSDSLSNCQTEAAASSSTRTSTYSTANLRDFDVRILMTNG